MITENLMGIKRVKGSYQKAKKPILINDLKSIIDVIDKEKNEKTRTKNRALILIGFAGGFRRSELVAIMIEDIDFVTEGVKIFIKRSKTDQSGEGMIKGIPFFSNPKYCPVISLKKWIEKSEIESGKIFDVDISEFLDMLEKKFKNLETDYILHDLIMMLKSTKFLSKLTLME